MRGRKEIWVVGTRFRCGERGHRGDGTTMSSRDLSLDTPFDDGKNSPLWTSERGFSQSGRGDCTGRGENHSGARVQNAMKRLNEKRFMWFKIDHVWRTPHPPTNWGPPQLSRSGEANWKWGIKKVEKRNSVRDRMDCLNEELRMPIYEYQCLQCNEVFEIFHKIDEDCKVTCPKCLDLRRNWFPQLTLSWKDRFLCERIILPPVERKGKKQRKKTRKGQSEKAGRKNRKEAETK